MQTTSVRLPEELYEKLRRAAFEDRRPQNEIMVEALDEALRRREGGR